LFERVSRVTEGKVGVIRYGRFGVLIFLEEGWSGVFNKAECKTGETPRFEKAKKTKGTAGTFSIGSNVKLSCKGRAEGAAGRGNEAILG